MVKALINATLYDHEHFYKNAYLLFDKQIFEVGKMADFRDFNYEIIDCVHTLVIPTFVLAHTHIYSTFARGLSLPFEPKNFQDILNQLWWKLDSKIDHDITFASGMVYGTECLKNGITTIIDHHASGRDIYGSLQTLKRAIVDTIGLRGCFCFETSDRFDLELCLRENKEFADNHHSSHVRGLFGMHASMSLSEASLQRIKAESAEIPIHIHVAESKMDQDDSLFQYHETVIQRLNRVGLLKKDSLLIHGVHLTDDDLQTIKNQQCSVVVNVTSNLNNGVGLPNIKKMQAMGINVLVGNDGLSSSLTHELQNIYFLNHHINESPTAYSLKDVSELLENNYVYANRLFEIKLGRFEPKYEADFQIIPYIPPTPINQENAFGHLFFGLFDSFLPKHVFVGGKQLINNYQVDPSLETLVLTAENQAEILWDRLKREEK